MNDFDDVPEFCSHGVEVAECPVHGDDQLDDPLDDGTLPLAPGQFDPLCEVRGETYPRNVVEAVGYEYEFARGAILSL